MAEETKYAVVRTDNMTGTDVVADLISLRYTDENSKPADIENGNVVKLDGLMENSREVYKAVTPSKATQLSDIALVASVEIMANERKRNLDEFINKADARPARGYRLHDGDVFGVTKEALSGEIAPAKGNLVELDASTKLKVVKTATSGSTQVGVIENVEIAGRYTYYVIRIKK